MKSEPILGNRNNRILVIDDNPAIHEDIRKVLGGASPEDPDFIETSAFIFGDQPEESGGSGFEIDSAFQGEEGLLKVQQAVEAGRPYALAFVDVRMPPGWDGVETITRVWKRFPDLQVVICTAYSDYSWSEMIRQIGRTDSLVILKKPFDNIEVLQLAHTLTEKWGLGHQVRCRLNDLDQLVNQRTTELQSANELLKQEIAERMHTEDALRLSEERFSKAFKASPIPLAIQSLEREIYVDANEGFAELTGYASAELIGRTPEELGIWGSPDRPAAMLKKLREEMSVHNLASQLRTKSGQMRDILLSVELFELDGQPYLLTIAQDITEQIRLEQQLRQAQKMEAVGQLAAGVAHDFNNILTVVQGHATLLLNNQPPDSLQHRPLKTICAAAERASKLVRQLLTFSRKQVRQPRPMFLGETLASVPDLFPRLLGEHIQVKVLAAPDLPQINADAGMMEQLLINLSLNSRDAMANGGHLTISADTVTVSPESARLNREARPGDFVCLSVADTGSGIPPEVLPRIFEPFFTTKPVGKGTGLGLATVYGIAKQHEGWIEVQTRPNEGTTFRVYLPTCGDKAASAPATESLPTVRGGRETVLVVEDEADVRDFVVTLLKSHGYQVFQAESGAQALKAWPPCPQRVDLLLTDMVMPDGVMGRELAERLLEKDPALHVIYTSGYSPGMAGKDLALLEGRNFLPKPYPPNRLLRMLREFLDN